MLRREKGERPAYRSAACGFLKKISCCAKFLAAAVGSRVLGESSLKGKKTGGIPDVIA
jgi:hypothetical protein